MDGVLNIRKEKGFTSFDVVAKLRGILHMKKIGHTGTLGTKRDRSRCKRRLGRRLPRWDLSPRSYDHTSRIYQNALGSQSSYSRQQDCRMAKRTYIHHEF